MEGNIVNPLPPKVDLETRPVLKKLANAHRALAELKGFAETMPNKNILINAIMINEAKDSSEIENIITTHDELFKAMSHAGYHNPAAKEVVSYRTALWQGYEAVKQKQMLSINMMVEIQQNIEENRAGIRKLPGTVLKNETTGEIVYTPPIGEAEIMELMTNLERYINVDEDDVDPLIKLAVVHHQFESIHPFYDGNGRSGRIVNVLYLVLKKLLDSPILYLSRYIIRNKGAYYQLLQEVRTHGAWEAWILYMLEGIVETAAETLELIQKINTVVEQTSADIARELPKIYTKELAELLFFEFYTKTAFIERGLRVSRRTAVTYLTALEEHGFLKSQRIGRERIYLNQRLFEAVKQVSQAR